ncbi:hypothetical protein GCM10025794_36580 [Massilia kyonggiensis]
MLNRFTIRQRMLAWNVTAIAFVVMVGGIGELAVGQLDGAMAGEFMMRCAADWLNRRIRSSVNEM